MIFPKRFTPIPSKAVILWGVLVHGLVLSVLVASGLSIMWLALLVVLVIFSLLRFLYIELWGRPRCRFAALTCLPDKSWELATAEGETLSAALTDFQSTALFVILYFRLAGNKRRCSVLLPRDSLEGQVYRTLLAMLRTGLVEPDADAP